MAWYYLGIAIGSLVILTGLGFGIYLSFKNREFRKMIKSIGQTAEDQINRDIKLWAKKTNNIFMPSGLFAYNGNKVFEIDSILITAKALIVVEIKSINGGVRGDAQDVNWDKVLGDVVHKITNPILQNEKHIEHIVDMTGLKIPTISLIVYSNRTAFIEVKNAPSHVVVIRHAALFDTLDKIEASLPVRFDDYEMKVIAGKIKSHRTSKRSDIKLHKNITERGRA